MRYLLALLLLLQPSVALHATFTSSTVATIWWEQPEGIPITCLRIYHAGAEYPAGRCWEHLPAGPMRVEFPGGLKDPAYRMQWGDKIVLAFGMEDVGQTTLGEVPSPFTVYLPSVRMGVGVRPLYLPVALH